MTHPSLADAPPRTARPSWIVAVVAATVVLAVAIGSVLGSFLLTTRASGELGAGAGYVTADALGFYEMRFDLPGEQRAQAISFLSHFPGVDAETILGEELERWLDDAMSESDTDFRYSTDIKPWFDGRVTFAMTSYPAGDMLGIVSSAIPTGVALLGVNDPAAAEAFGVRARGEVAASAGGSFTSEAYAGTMIWSLDVSDDMTEIAPNLGFSYAVTDDHVLLATGADEIRTALDVRDGRLPGMADDEELAGLLGRLPEDRVGTMATRSGPMIAEMRAALTELDPALGSLVDVYESLIPELQVGSARFAADRMVFETFSSLPPRGMGNAERDLAAHVPAGVLFYVEGDEVGEVVAEVVLAAKAGVADRPEAEQLALVEAALGGDLETFVEWMGSTALVAGWDGDAPYGGLVVSPTDEVQAAGRLAELRALAALGATSEPGLTVEEVEHGDTTITSISMETGDMFLPSVAVEYAIADGYVLIGIGEGFVARMLDLDAADSLAADDRYSDALEATGGTSNAGVAWLDLAAVREAVEAALPPEIRQPYEADVQSWVQPFDYVIAVTVVEGDTATAIAAIVVR